MAQNYSSYGDKIVKKVEKDDIEIFRISKLTDDNSVKVSDNNKQNSSHFKNQSNDNSYCYIILLSCTLIQGLSACMFSSYGILLIGIVESTGSSNALISLFGGLWSLLLGFSSLFIGPCAVSYGSRPVIIFGAIISSIGFIMSSFAANMIIVLIGMGIFQGVGTGCFQMVPFLIVSKWFVKRRAGALSFLSFGLGVGMLLWAPVTALLIQQYSWRGTLLLLGGIYLNGIVLGLLLIEPGEEQLSTPLSLKKTMIRNLDKKLIFTKNFFIYIFSTSLLYFGHLMILAYLPRKLVDIGRTKFEGSLMVTITSAVSCLIRLIIGTIADKKYFHKTIIYFLSSFVAGITSFLTLASDSHIFYFCFSAFYGVTSGFYVALTVPVAVEVFDLKYLANVTAWTLLMAGIFMMIATTSGGWLYDKTGEATYNFVFGGIILTISGLLLAVLVVILKKQKKTEKNTIDLEA